MNQAQTENPYGHTAYAALKGSHAEVEVSAECAAMMTIADLLEDLAGNLKGDRRRLYKTMSLDFTLAAAKGAEGQGARAGHARTVIRLPRCVCALVAEILDDPDVESPELRLAREALRQAGVPGPGDKVQRPWWQFWM